MGVKIGGKYWACKFFEDLISRVEDSLHLCREIFEYGRISTRFQENFKYCRRERDDA